MRSTLRFHCLLAISAVVLGCGGPAGEPDGGPDSSALLACPAPESIHANDACAAPPEVACPGSREATCDRTQLAFVPCTCTDGRWACEFSTCPGELECPELPAHCETGARCRGPFVCPDGIELSRTCDCMSEVWTCVVSECP